MIQQIVRCRKTLLFCVTIFIILLSSGLFYFYQVLKYQTYHYSDQMYAISFYYPKEFIAPQDNYFATGNIIQNEFNNDLGVKFIFMAANLVQKQPSQKCLDENITFCETHQLSDHLTKFLVLDDISGSYSVTYVDDSSIRTYKLVATVPSDVTPILRKKVRNAVKSFRLRSAY